jgi:hypothetical protein
MSHYVSALDALLAENAVGNDPRVRYGMKPLSADISAQTQLCIAKNDGDSSLTPSASSNTARFTIATESKTGFACPQSVRLYYTIKTTTTEFKPLTGPWGIWANATLWVKAGTTMLENIPLYGRHHTMFGWNLLSRDEQYEEFNHGWAAAPTTNKTSSVYTFTDTATPVQPTIPVSTSCAVSHTIELSLFRQRKLLALLMTDITLSLTLNTTTTDYSQSGSATNFTISDLYLTYDHCDVNEDLLRIYRLPLVYPLLYYSQQSVVLSSGTNRHSFTCPRTHSRIYSVWLTFNNASEPSAFSFIFPATPESPLVASLNVGKDFYPHAVPAQNVSQYYMMLQSALHGRVPNIDTAAFTKATSGNTDTAKSAFALVWDLCEAPGDILSSRSTLDGDELIFTLENLSGSAALYVTITVVAVSALVVSDQGAPVLMN